MNSKKKTLSVVIANYKADKYLKGCVDSLHKNISGDIFFDIVIVNNEEGANLDSIANSSSVKIVHSPKNNGFGAASNLGAKNSTGEFLFFLNPDVEVISPNIHEAIEALDQDPSIGVIGAGLITPEGKKQEWSAGTEVGFFRILANNLGFIKDKRIWESKDKLFTHWVAGTAFFIRRELFEKLGGFDEEFFMYFEDVDLSKRIRNMGKKVAFYPHLRVLHYGGGSYEKESKKSQKKHYYASQDLYFKKHRGIMEAAMLKFFRKLHC